MKRKIIKIDEEKCNGCGLCIPNCAEGALQVIGGKARLISDLFCDGLGACIGHCPEDAIEIVEREAEPYDETTVMRENIVPGGPKTIKAHLEHLKEHGETAYLQQALAYLSDYNIANPFESKEEAGDRVQGKALKECPGVKTMHLNQPDPSGGETTDAVPSRLRQWPIQLHLLSPTAPYLKGADLLLAADCTAFAFGDFHGKFLQGKSLAIACPKLDISQDVYLGKLVTMINDSKLNTITVLIMEVPCCGGLAVLALKAVERAERKVPVKKIVVGIQGNVLSEEWL